MRITNPTILRGYQRNLGNLMSAKTRSMQKIMSGRSFARASENPIAAAKALKVRKQLMNTAQFRENLDVADKFYTEAETSLLEVSDQLATIRETIIAAVNTTKDKPTDLQIYAQQLETKGRELCSIFNTNTAERMIFGGESDNPQPFTIENDENGNASMVLYHGVPINAYTDSSKFPYSKDVYMDIGLGMVVNQDTQNIDPQSTLRISFNGASVTGCGADKGVADIDLSSMKAGFTYTLDVYAGGIKKTIEVKGGEYAAGAADPPTSQDEIARNEETIQNLQKALNNAYKYEPDVTPKVGKDGAISIENGTVCVTNNPYTDPDKLRQVKVENLCGYGDKDAINVKNLSEGKSYSVKVKVGNDEKTISFTGQENTAKTVEEINNQLKAAFEDAEPHKRVIMSDDGVVSSEGTTVRLNAVGGDTDNKLTVTRNEIHDYKVNYDALTDGTYAIKVAVDGGEQKDVTFTIAAADDKTAKMTKINDAVKSLGIKLDENGKITGGKVVIDTAGDDKFKGALTDNARMTSKVDLESLKEGTKYSLRVNYNGKEEIVTFEAKADPADTKTELKNALDKVFGNDVITVGNGGNNTVELSAATDVTAESAVANGTLEVDRQQTYSNNYIQLTLDAAKALRNGDIEYANGCIDRIVSAAENLLLEIADLGCNEEFIEFNDSRFVSREYNLSDRQKTLEATDYEKEITLMKQYEAIYNATLQMASQVVPNSIFNYIN